MKGSQIMQFQTQKDATKKRLGGKAVTKFRHLVRTHLMKDTSGRLKVEREQQLNIRKDRLMSLLRYIFVDKQHNMI